MSELQRKRAIKIIKKYWYRSFTNATTVRGYIQEVRTRLAKFGIKNVPKTPIRFLKYCKKYGLLGD